MSGSVTPAQLQALVEKALPDARVDVHLYSGDDHFEMVVISEAFAGKPRVRRHQMVYAALGDHMREAVHALALKTLTPEEAA